MSSSLTEHQIDVTMPQMGVSVAEGTVVEWRKEVGDAVAADETICEISTDKIDTEVPAPAAGVVAEILVPVGETVDVGTVLARLTSDAGPPAAAGRDAPPDTAGEVGESEAAAALDPPSETASPRPAGEARAPAAQGANGAAAPAVTRGGRRYSPVVLRIAAEHGLDLERIEGTGRGGRVRKQDVLAALDAGDPGAAGEDQPPLHIESPYRPDPEPSPAAAPATSPGDGARTEPLSRVRRSIGEHMVRSLQTAAHCTTIVEADMSRIQAARARSGLTYLPYVARCVIGALQEHPTLNAWLEDDRLTVHEEVNLGIAVSLGDDGLIVPVLHRAQDLSAEGLGRRIRELAGRARAREITPDDVRGGTFTITNPGAFGAIAATPIINQPQVAILDLEAVVKRPVVISGPDGEDSIAIRPITNLCMSWDHRALDGAKAAQFLASVKRNVEAWSDG